MINLFFHINTHFKMILLKLFLKGAVCRGEDERGCPWKEDFWSATEKCWSVRSSVFVLILHAVCETQTWHTLSSVRIYWKWKLEHCCDWKNANENPLGVGLLKIPVNYILISLITYWVLSSFSPPTFPLFSKGIFPLCSKIYITWKFTT